MTTMKPYTPRSVIAGRVPATKRNALHAARSSAAALMGTDQIAVFCSFQAGQAWYLAVLASELAGSPGTATPLTAALPGAPDHQGDGAYIAEVEGGLQAVVVKAGDAISSFVGTPLMVNRFMVLNQVATCHVCAAPGQLWKTPVSSNGLAAAPWLNFVSLFGQALALLAIAIWWWAAPGATDIALAQDKAKSKQQADLKTTVQLLSDRPYPPALSHMQKAVEQAAREGGRLVQFEHKAGRSSWSLMVNDQPREGSAP